MFAALVFLFLFPLFVQGKNNQQVLTLEAYKTQVLQNDPATRSAQTEQQGAVLAEKTSDLTTGLNFFVNYGRLDDARPTAAPSFQGTRTFNESYAIGLQQQTPLGLKWSVSQNRSNTNITGYTETSLLLPNYTDEYPKVELSLPLWRNFLGRETRGDLYQVKSQLRAQALQAEINWIRKQTEIEETYYNLLTQQEAYLIQKDSLERAEKILSWTKSRVSRNLTDESDLFQSQAAVAARKLELATIETKLKTVVRDFNIKRGLVSDAIIEKLIDRDINIRALKLDRLSKKIRKDLQAQKELIESQRLQYQSQREKVKPTLDLIVSYQNIKRSGRETTLSQNILTAPYPLFVNGSQEVQKKGEQKYIGIQFNMPLDQLTANNSRKGFDALMQSRELAEKVRLQDQYKTWESTVDQAEQLAQQIEILKNLETIQQKKADLERRKLNQGRTTTFQVLNFEQDYYSARLQRINMEYQIRQFVNQLALFE